MNNKYQVGCVIGSGGFGITYAGWNLSLNKPIAIKEFFPHNRVSRNAEETFLITPNGSEENQLIYYKGIDWFQREARTLAALGNTPNVVHVEDYFRENGTSYIIMDFIRGKSLTAYAREKGGVLSPEEVFSLMKKPIEALSKVHRYGLIHRDISPDNLMIDDHGEVWLVDFGAATALDEGSELRATELFMNKSFAPPELEAEKELGTWSDIYSICASMVYLMSDKRMPSSAEREQNDTIPALLKPLKLKYRQRKALMCGLHLKTKQRTENTALLLNELYKVPLPKSEAEKKRQKQQIRYLRLGIVACYAFMCMWFMLKLDKQTPAACHAWFHKDVEQAMILAEDFAEGYYAGGICLRITGIAGQHQTVQMNRFIKWR